MLIAEQSEQYSATDNDNPLPIAEGTQLYCVRCNHNWIPHSKCPHMCPE